MHIAMMVASGLLVLAAVYYGARALGRDGSSRTVARASGAFALVWLGVSVADFAIGVTNTGFSVPAEIAAHAAIFGIPAAAALYVAIQATRRDPARPV